MSFIRSTHEVAERSDLLYVAMLIFYFSSRLMNTFSISNILIYLLVVTNFPSKLVWMRAKLTILLNRTTKRSNSPLKLYARIPASQGPSTLIFIYDLGKGVVARYTGCAKQRVRGDTAAWLTGGCLEQLKILLSQKLSQTKLFSSSTNSARLITEADISVCFR